MAAIGEAGGHRNRARRQPDPIRQHIQRPGKSPIGRPPKTPPDVVQRIREQHAAGHHMSEIARMLDADHEPTPHGGDHWQASTVRYVLIRTGVTG
jgi:Recombinase